MKANLAAIARTASLVRCRVGLWGNKFPMGKTPHLWLMWRVMKIKRRTFITTSSAALAAGFFTSCGKGKQPELKIYSWADYIDPELVAEFEQAQSCRLVIDAFDSNESMHAKLSAGATGYDVVVPSSYMVKTLVRENMLLPLDHSKLPNLKHVDAGYLQRALDPGMKHSVPYMMAPTCMAWLSSKVNNAEASYRMFDRTELKGRITLLDDMREVLGAALRSLGFSINTKDPAQLAQARDVVIRWKKNIAKFDSEQYKSGIASGEFHLVQGYAGDLLQVAGDNPDIVVKIPQEGTAFTCDDLCIFKDSKAVDLAHRFIDFLIEPRVAAKNMEYIAYRAPNQSAYAMLSEEFRGNEVLFPSEEVFAKCEPIDDLGDALALWSGMWDAVKAS
ncbi:MAG: spermidine/putrescine ABC transporter substrate-binding protein [Verrucomicrobiota bacterium]